MRSDEYYTPDYAVDIIIPFLKARRYEYIVCPFDKEDSLFVRRLSAAGFSVAFGHIDYGADFFQKDLSEFEGADCIVSNPPFSVRDKVFERLYEIGKPFAMITGLNSIFDSRARFELFSNNPFELLVPRGRMAFYDEQNNQLPAPNFQSGYVCWRVLPQKITFTEMDKEMLK